MINPDDQLAELLLAYDTELAAGNTSLECLGSSLAEVPEEVLLRLQNARRCLLELEEVWPRTAMEDGDELPRSLGRFQILRELGRGGFGIVYLAYDDKLSREVALKVQRPEALISSELRRRFLREAKAAARLEHPQIAGVHEVGEAGLRIWLATEYCDGDSLAHWLRTRSSPVPPRDAAAFMFALAGALEYSHQQGVLHRDIKPTNVLLQKQATADTGELSAPSALSAFAPKLIDFGLAKLLDDNHHETRTQSLVGTPAYMSPEQAAGQTHKIGPRADVYGLGAILYEMLTLRPPFVGESDFDTLRQVHHEDPLRPRRLNSGVPRDLETICLACLEKDPRRRYATAGALAEDLQRFLNNLPLRVRPPTMWRRGQLLMRRHPGRAVMAVSIAAVAVALPAALVAHSIRLGRERTLAVSAQVAAEESARQARASEAQVRQHVYVADMRVTGQLLHDGDLASLGPLLDRHRGPVEKSAPQNNAPMPFEWRYFRRFPNAVTATLDAHRAALDLVTFCSQGDTLLTSGVSDPQVRAWRMPRGEPLCSFPVRMTPPRRTGETTSALSPDGHRAATLTNLHTVVVWDVASGQELRRFEHRNTVLTIAFSPDGLSLAAGDEQATTLWSCETGERVSTHPPARLVTFAPDGRQMALVAPHSAANHVHLRDLPSSPSEADLWFPASVQCVSYSPDGTRMVCSTDHPSGSGIWVYHPRTGASLFGAQGLQEEHIDRVGFSKDGRWLVASVADGSLRFWDGHTGKPLRALRGPATRLTDFAFSSDDRWLATGTSQGKVLLWDRKLLDPCDELVPEHQMAGPVVYSPDGQTLAACTLRHQILLIDSASGRAGAELSGHADRIRDVQFCADGSRLASTDGETVRCWSVPEGIQLWSVPAGKANCVAWSPDMSLLAASGFDMLIHLHDARDGSEKALWTSHDVVNGLAFLPGKTLLVSAGGDGMVRFWDYPKALRIEPEEPQIAAFSAGHAIGQFRLSPDGRSMAIGCQNGEFTIRQLTDKLTAEEPSLRRLWEGSFASAFTFSPDGQTIGLGSSEGQFQAFDHRSQETRYVLSGRRVGGTSGAYHPDGNTLATVSPQGCLTFWNLEKWQTCSFDGSPLLAVRSLAFSPDGSRLAIATDDGVVSDHPGESAANSPTVRRFAPRNAAVSLITNRSLNIAGAPWDKTGPGFRIFDVATLRESPPLGQSERAAATGLIAWSPRGLLAAGSHDGTVSVWDTQTAKLVSRFAVNARGSNVTSWQAAAGRPPISLKTLRELDGVIALTFSPSGDKLAVATRGGTVQLRSTSDLNDHRDLCTNADEVMCLAFSPSGSMLLANRRGQLLYWDLDDRRQSTVPKTIDAENSAFVCSIAFTRDGQTLAIGRHDGTTQLLKTRGLLSPSPESSVASPVVLTGHLDRVAAVDFAPDGKTLATGSWDATVRLWHVASGQEVVVFKGHHRQVQAVAFSPDGTVLATAGQRDADLGEVFLWRATP